MTNSIYTGDLLRSRGRNLPLLERGSQLLQRLYYYDSLVQRTRDWVTTIQQTKRPINLYFRLFDSLLSQRPAIVRDAEEKLGIFLYLLPKLQKQSLAEEKSTTYRAFCRLNQNSRRLVQKLQKAPIDEQQTILNRARFYVQLTNRIERAFTSLNLYPHNTLQPLRDTHYLWDSFVTDLEKQKALPVKLVEGSEINEVWQPESRESSSAHTRV